MAEFDARLNAAYPKLYFNQAKDYREVAEKALAHCKEAETLLSNAAIILGEETATAQQRLVIVTTIEKFLGTPTLEELAEGLIHG